MFLALFGEARNRLEGDEQRRERTVNFLASIAPLILDKIKVVNTKFQAVACSFASFS